MPSFLSYINELPTGWELYYHYNPGPAWKLTQQVSENLCRPYQMWSNACYAISRKGAEKAIQSAEENPGIYLPIDWHFLKQLDKFDVYTVRPNKEVGCRLANIESTYLKFENQHDLTELL
jgi:GR25 family glycosyltransferase involved in LPS biosynthesis